MTVLVTVTNNIIKRSAYTPSVFLPTDGAVAMALKDLMPDIHVYPHYMGFTDYNGYEVGWDLPERIGNYIQSFNSLPPQHRLQLKPLQFKLLITKKQVHSLGGVYRVKYITRTSNSIVRLRNA